MSLSPLRVAAGPRTRVALALRLIQAAAVSCLVAVGFAATFLIPQGVATPSASSQAPATSERQVEEAIAEFECSADGLGPEVIPASALIRTGAGVLKHVTFDRGWAVHTSSSSPAMLVAVCESEPSRR